MSMGLHRIMGMGTRGMGAGWHLLTLGKPTPVPDSQGCMGFHRFCSWEFVPLELLYIGTVQYYKLEFSHLIF